MPMMQAKSFSGSGGSLQLAQDALDADYNEWSAQQEYTTVQVAAHESGVKVTTYRRTGTNDMHVIFHAWMRVHFVTPKPGEPALDAEPEGDGVPEGFMEAIRDQFGGDAPGMETDEATLPLHSGAVAKILRIRPRDELWNARLDGFGDDEPAA
jgi:hypothetical protein